jgi:hypothetical protein
VCQMNLCEDLEERPKFEQVQSKGLRVLYSFSITVDFDSSNCVIICQRKPLIRNFTIEQVK